MRLRFCSAPGRPSEFKRFRAQQPKYMACGISCSCVARGYCKRCLGVYASLVRVRVLVGVVMASIWKPGRKSVEWFGSGFWPAAASLVKKA